MADPSFFDAMRLPSTVLIALDNRAFHVAVQPWHYLLRMAHILSTAAFFGGIVLFDLRLIGVRSAAKLKALSADIMPWLYIIFGIAMLSGVLLFLYDPIAVGSRTYFVPKIILIGLGLVNATLYNRFAYEHALAADARTPCSAKVAGALSIAFWVGVVASSAMNIEGVPGLSSVSRRWPDSVLLANETGRKGTGTWKIQNSGLAQLRWVWMSSADIRMRVNTEQETFDPVVEKHGAH